MTEPSWAAAPRSIPPCGVQPFRGFVNYAAPLTFLFQAEEPAYFVLRAMYARLWCNVNVMRSQPDTLLPLCKLFEELVQHHHPSLFFHMLQIGVTPLQIALPWIQFGFVERLESVAATGARLRDRRAR